MQGGKLTYIFGSHLAPKYFKVAANSKKLVVIMKHTQTIFTLSLGCHCTREIKLIPNRHMMLSKYSLELQKGHYNGSYMYTT